jgi:hypothetical protein
MPQIVAAVIAEQAITAPVTAAAAAQTAAQTAAQAAAMEAAKQAAAQQAAQQTAQQAVAQQTAQQAAAQQAAQAGVAQAGAVNAGPAAGIAQAAGLPPPGAAVAPASAATPASAAAPASAAPPASPLPPAAPPPPPMNPPIQIGKPIDFVNPESWMSNPGIADKDIAAKVGERFIDSQSSGIAKGAQEAVNWMKANKFETGLGLMAAGQVYDRFFPEKKKEYRNTVDMSKFKPSIPQPIRYKPSYADGGPVQRMADINALGANTGYPMASLNTPAYSNSAIQSPRATNVIAPSGGPAVDAFSGEPRFADGGIANLDLKEYSLQKKQHASKALSDMYKATEAERNKQMAAARAAMVDKEDSGGTIRRSRTQELGSPFSAAIEEHNRLAKKTKTQPFKLAKSNLGDIDTYMDIPVDAAASGGIMSDLGGYSDGGRLLRGPGDGVSDSIPAVIGKHQPARLADGEFVIPARIVSELGNGSTEAGARKLYAMMERIQSTRKKSIGKKKVAVNSRADKHLPA